MMQESHISGGNSGEQEAAAPAPCCDEAQCEAAAAPASKSRQHASLQPEPMYISQPPASPASMGVCIQARVLPPTGCTDTMAGEITSIGPAEVSDCQTQSAEQVWLPNTCHLGDIWCSGKACSDLFGIRSGPIVVCFCLESKGVRQASSCSKVHNVSKAYCCVCR